MSKLTISDLAITPEFENLLQELTASEFQNILGGAKVKIKITDTKVVVKVKT